MTPRHTVYRGPEAQQNAAAHPRFMLVTAPAAAPAPCLLAPGFPSSF